MNFKEVAEQLIRLYERLNRAQRIVIATTLLAVIGFIIFIIIYTRTGENSNYAVLFDHLSPKDAGLIIQELEKEAINYRIPRDGVIEVPKDVVYKVRISVASQGIPKESHVGFELFDKQEFGATDFDQKIKFLRALEGELARTISALVPIESATVHIAIPKESVFVSKNVPPSASVMIKEVEGMKLTRKQIAGIKNLVAAAVPNLTTEYVKLVNVLGEPLGESSEDAIDGELVSQQIAYKNRYEDLYEQKIISVLAPFIGGKDRVVAKVTIDFDFAQRSSVQEHYDPENVVRSEQTLDEKKEGSSPQSPGGVPGAVSNIGPVQGLEDSKIKQKYEKSSTTTNYEISKTVSNVKGPFAIIKRVSAAVVVDGKYIPEEDGKIVYQPRSSEELNQISSLVKKTIGFDVRRGDQVSVSNFQFESLAKAAEKSPYKAVMDKFYDYMNPITPILKFIFLVIVLFVFYKKVIVPFSERMLEIPIDDSEEAQPLLVLDEDEEESLTEKFTQMRKKVEEQLGLTDDFDEDELKYEVLLEKMTDIAEEKTEELAALISALIRDETEMENSAINQMSGGKK